MIPVPSLSNRPLQLLTPTTPPHRILSHPVTIESPTYPRNAFTFNFALVLAESTSFHTYLPVTQKLASLFRHLEETSRFLTTELKLNPQANEGRIHAICELLLEDLNTYSECMIPIDGTTSTLNLKLFPLYPTPPRIEPWYVPLMVVNLDDMKEEESWDLTLLRVLPHINGINSVRRIADFANTDLKLVRKAIRELAYYGCVRLMDIFSFSAIYAPTEKIGDIVSDEKMRQECLDYVTIPSLGNISAAGQDGIMSHVRLIELYLSLHQGQSVKSWVLEHGGESLVKAIDIRRFMTYGVIKGFLYRVHRYAIANEHIKAIGKGKNKKTIPRASLSRHPHNDDGTDGDRSLTRFLNGTHCFDEICTELGISERELTARLKAWGEDVQIFSR